MVKERYRHTDTAQESLHAVPYFFALGSTGDRILDVGVGDGCSFKRAIRWLEIRPPRMVGVDICNSILLTLPKETNLSPVNADALRLPFGDSIFPLVISSQVIEHIKPEHYPDFITELVRVTEPSGRVVITTMNKDFPYNVKRHKSHVFEFDTVAAKQLSEACGQFGSTELYLIVPSQRFVHAYSERAKFWFLRPIRGLIPRQISELALMFLTRGEIRPGLDMRSDFQIKKLVDLKKGELFTDFLIEVVKKGG